MPPAGYPAFLQYLQSGRVSEFVSFGEGPPPRRLADRGSRGDAPPAGDWETTAVNIFEKQRNLLWAKDLKHLTTCSYYVLIHVVFYIVNANLIVKMGGMGKDQVASDHPDNPSSRC